MFEKKDKINERDVGFLEDAFEILKHSVADEGHCLGNFLCSGDQKDLYELEDARKFRTDILDRIIIFTGAEIKDQCWCRIKHLVGKAIISHELCTRAMTIKDLDSAIFFANKHKESYLKFLFLFGVNEENINNQTSA